MKIIKRNIVESLIDKTFPERTNKYFTYGVHDKSKYDELFEKFNKFIYNFFRVEKYNSNFNMKEFPETSTILDVVKEAINDIGNQLFISFRTVIISREYLKENNKNMSLENSGLDDENFNHYFNKMMDVKFFNLDYFISHIYNFGNMLGVTIPKSSEPVEDEKAIRNDILNNILKGEALLKSNEKLIVIICDKIRERVFGGINYRHIIQEGPEQYGSRDLCIERFENTMLKDNIQICMNIIHISNYLQDNFHEFNPHVVNQINVFFNGILNVLVEDFICGSYILSINNVKEE